MARPVIAKRLVEIARKEGAVAICHGDPSFTLTAKIWKERTDATGIISKQGNGGGTFAHRDIAIDFYAWVFPEKRYELVKLIAGKAAFFEAVQHEIAQIKVKTSED